MTHYSATSLEQIADELERLAGDATAKRSDDIHADQAYAVGLREAATLVRNTRLADPAMEAMVKALEQATVALDDWLHVYAPDECNPQNVAKSRARIGEFGTLAYIAGVLQNTRAALKLAKDNGHV